MFFSKGAGSQFSGFFHIPNIVGHNYSTGRQPNASGESVTPWSGAAFELKGWPNAVQSINALANNSGTPHARGAVPVNDAYAFSPENYLFIAGTLGKSRG